jgi:hypothetical protein
MLLTRYGEAVANITQWTDLLVKEATVAGTDPDVAVVVRTYGRGVDAWHAVTSDENPLSGSRGYES